MFLSHISYVHLLATSFLLFMKYKYFHKYYVGIYLNSIVNCTLFIFLLLVLFDMSIGIFSCLLKRSLSPDQCFLFHRILALLFNMFPGKPFVLLNYFCLIFGTSTFKASCSGRDQAWPLIYFKRFLAKFEVFLCCSSFNSINFT